jgi:DNA anti-recombination protein RmuC
VSELDILKLETDEELVYRVLLVSGQLSIGEMQFALQKTREIVENAIESLVSKNLIRKIPGIDDRYSSLLPLGSLKDELIKAANAVENTTVRQDSAKIVEDLSHKLADTAVQFEDKLKQKKSELDSAYQSLDQQILDNKDMTNKRIETIKAENESQTSEILDKNHQSFTNIVDTSIKSTKSSVDQSKAQGADHLSNAKTMIEANKNDNYPKETTLNLLKLDESAGKFQELEKSTSDSQMNALNRMSDKFTGLVQDVSTTFSSKTSELSGIEENVKTTIKDSISEISTISTENSNKLLETNNQISNAMVEYEESGKAVFEKTQSFIQVVTTELGNTTNSLQESMKKSDSEASSLIRGEISGLNDKLSSAVTKSGADLISSTNSVQKSLSEVLQSETQSIESKLDNLFKTVLEETKTQFESLRAEFDGKLQKIGNVMESNLAQTQTEFDTSLETTKSTIFSSLDGAKAKNTEAYASHLESFNNSIEMLNNESSSVLNQELEKLSSNILDIRGKLENISGLINTNTTETTEKLSKLSEDNQNLLQTSFSSAIKSLNEIVNQHSNEFKSVSESVHNELNTLINQNSTSFETVLKETVDNFKSTINTKYEGIINKINASIDQIATNQTEIITSILSTNDSTLSGVGSELGNLLNRLIAEGAKVKEELNNIHLQFNNLVQERSTKLVNEIFNQLTEIMTQSKNTISSNFSDVSQLSQTTIDEPVSVVHQAFEKFLVGYEANAANVSNSAKSLAGVLDNIYKVQQDTKTTQIDTTHIVGTDAVVAQMNGIIKRTKSKATILVPKTSMVNQEIILSMPRTAQVTIISYIDEVTDKDWISKMHNATANVTLRSLGKEGTGHLPDFLGCEREGEEIMLAAKDDKAKTYIGITSLAEDFVKILGNIVIADYARGKSKQLPKA